MLIMGDHVKQVNMNAAMLSANTFSVKEEQCQEDSFIEDKMYISQTAITIDNAELQGKIKQYDESTCLDNIKTELASSEGAEVQNDNLKMGGGISADDIKIEIDNGLPYCEHCEAYYVDYCIDCGMLGHILNKNALDSLDKGSRQDIPNDILEIQDLFGQTGIYALRIIPVDVKFGPFSGLTTTECAWEMKGDKFVLDKNKSTHLNWMQYINPTRNTSKQNLSIFHSEDDIYYQSTRQIQVGDELLVYFGEEYGNRSNKIARVASATTTKNIGKDIFACTFCCLGFRSKLHLAKHKTVCVESEAGNFFFEELTQCPFCKIHLEPKEYFEHHMAFCCERNARKNVLPTPPAKEATTALNRRTRCLRQIYKCEQCKYRTRYQAELKEHIKQHNEVKIYKCGICNRRFMTKEILRLHVENTHAYVGGEKENQKHSTSDYKNTLIKLEHSSSQDQKKMFKCSRCVFRAKSKQSLRRHMKLQNLKGFDHTRGSCDFETNSKPSLRRHIIIKHMKQFDHKCDSCEYRTNFKHNLGIHVKTKHLKQFDYKCDSCDYRTNKKSSLRRHIRAKHLNEFDYKCDSCEFRTNTKTELEKHIKTKHSKEFDFKCGKCEFGTCYKTDLKRHIKSKHSKQFDYKCDSCEFGANNKNHLVVHIKTKHLKEFDFKCDSCEFGTNKKNHLKRHINSKHLKQVDYKCGSCEYGVTEKADLERHIKSKHLKQFDFKCDKCEFGTCYKTDLKRHIKSKHSTQFDYKCASCEYGANYKNQLVVHIKTKHLKQFDFKCDSCEFGTNTKKHLEYHIKSKHLKQFDYKCDKCEYRTNNKSDLEKHIKSKHLKEFDYKCASCKYRTNNKSSLNNHMKRKHL